MLSKIVHTKENCRRCGGMITYNWPVPQPHDWRWPVVHCPKCGVHNRASHMPVEWGGNPPSPRADPQLMVPSSTPEAPEHVTVEQLCDSLGIPGKPTMAEALSWVKARLQPEPVVAEDAREVVSG